MTTTAHPFLIRPADSSADLEAIRACFNAYVEWLGEDLSFQGYANELDTLPGLYAPPSGALLLAVDAVNQQVLGCVAIRPLELDHEGRRRRRRRRACEMKRLFVWPEVRGRGISRALVSHVVRMAEEAGYHEMLLDTLPRMRAAIQLYASEGFVPTEPYYYNPLRGTIYMTKRLTTC